MFIDRSDLRFVMRMMKLAVGLCIGPTGPARVTTDGAQKVSATNGLNMSNVHKRLNVCRPNKLYRSPVLQRCHTWSDQNPPWQ